MSEYSDFAYFYDELTGNISYRERAEYFDNIIKKYGNKRERNNSIVLDMACGTGSLSFEMANLGYDVIGIDSSYDMLSEAISKNINNENNIVFLCQKMQNLDLYGTVDVVICALDSINHITSEKEIEQVFKRVGLFLDENAIFIFDVNTQYKHEKILGNNTFIYDCENVYCIWQNNFEKENYKVNISLDFFKKENNVYHRLSESFTERAYSQLQIENIINNAEMQIIDIFEADTFNKPKDDTQREVYIVKNKKLMQKF